KQRDASFDLSSASPPPMTDLLNFAHTTRGSRSQPAALVSDRDDAALFPAIRILERYGSAKSGRARRVRTACRRPPDPTRSSTICCRSFGLRARPSKAGPSRVPHSGERSSEQSPPRCRIQGQAPHRARCVELLRDRNNRSTRGQTRALEPTVIEGGG